MSKIQEAIETMNVMESNYSHIRKSDKEFEAIETGKSALQDQAEREKCCEYCNGGIYSTAAYDFEVRGKYMKFCPYCGRDLRKLVSK